MSGTNVTKITRKPRRPELTLVTPEMAVELLEHNTLNRPLSDRHVQRIARQIIQGKWKFNGDTIKIAVSEDVLDGQHRLWGIIEAKTAVETIIVYGIHRDAFATIDTVRKIRTGGDVLALAGVTRYRSAISIALTWLMRWQRGVLEEYRAPQNRIENSDIEESYAAHPGMTRAVERAMKLRGLATPSIMGFLYYIITSRNAELAERMMDTLENPASVAINDPFFRLRSYFTLDHLRKKDALMTIALTIKAANAVNIDKAVEVLAWRSQGEHPEAFPTLEI